MLTRKWWFSQSSKDRIYDPEDDGWEDSGGSVGSSIVVEEFDVVASLCPIH